MLNSYAEKYRNPLKRHYFCYLTVSKKDNVCGKVNHFQSATNHLYNTAAEEEGKRSFSFGCILWVNCGLDVTCLKRVVASDECVGFNANVIMHLTSDPHLVDLWL